MLRRVMMAVASGTAGWSLLVQPAVADYPPVPPTVTTTIVTTTIVTTTTTTVPKGTTTTVPKKKVPPTTAVTVAPTAPRVVVVVRGAPVQRRRALVFTGTETAIPLTALATASVGLGVTLVCLSRLGWPGRRRRRHHHRRLA